MKIVIETSTSYRGRNSRPNWISLLAFVAVAIAAGGIGIFFSPGRSAAAAAWYAVLAKPPWIAPSNWFVPVWTALYVLMGIAGWLVSRERYHQRCAVALAVYAVQLLLNAAWAPLFFGLSNIGAGLFDIVALWLAIVWTLREFYSVKPPAAWLLVPYLAWVSYATALNFSIWHLNQ